MRQLFSLLLIVGLSAEFLPACTDAEAKQGYLEGAAARRSRGASCPYEAATDHYWDFETTGDDDYLKAANQNDLEADSYTIVALVHFEDVTAKDNCVVGQYALNQYSWKLSTNDDDLYGASGYVNCNTRESESDLAVLNNSEMILVAMTFDYSGNPGTNDSPMIIWSVKGAGTESFVDAIRRGPVPDCTGGLAIGTEYGQEGTRSMDGKIYMVAYIPAVLVQQDLEDIYNGVKHPACDFTTPLMYFDGSKAVAGTYALEIGPVMTVTGDPVQGP